EVGLPSEQQHDAAAYGLHPALWDAALHAIRLVEPPDRAGSVQMPFAWRGVTLSASGAAALRGRVSPADGDAVALTMTDLSGQPVATVESLASRPVAVDQLRTATHGTLFCLDWMPLSSDGAVLPPESRLYRCAPGQPARQAAAHALAELQTWLAEEKPAQLVVVTTAGDLAHAAVRGLVRSAQSEHPDRVVLVDLDGEDETALGAAVASGEPEVAVRDGRLLVPRLVPAAPAPRFGWDPDGTVLITGGTGTLGGLLARH